MQSVVSYRIYFKDMCIDSVALLLSSVCRKGTYGIHRFVVTKPVDCTKNLINWDGGYRGRILNQDLNLGRSKRPGTFSGIRVSSPSARIFNGCRRSTIRYVTYQYHVKSFFFSRRLSEKKYQIFSTFLLTSTHSQ
jgi:hypothetical protein